MDGGLRLMVALPSLRSEADQVGLARPGAAGARGVQSVGPNESAPRIGKVLQDFGQESDGRENLGVGFEEVELFIGEKTVVNHVSHLFAKTGASNRVEAAAFATKHGLAGA